MAMPSPASDSMEMDFAMMAGISICHLQGNPTSQNDQIRKSISETNSLTGNFIKSKIFRGLD